MFSATREELESLHVGLRDIYSNHDLDTLGPAAARAARRLVPCEIAVYNELDPLRQRIIGIADPPEATADVVRISPAWEKFMHQHPLVEHFRRLPNDQPRKISDFVSIEVFRRTDLYREALSQVGISFQMVVTMPAPQPLVVGISLNRAHEDFSEQDRGRLELLRPHLRQAYENAALVSDLRRQLGRAENALDRLQRGLITLDPSARLLDATPTAARFLYDWLGVGRIASAGLPEELALWAQEQIARLQLAQTNPKPPSPWIHSGPGGQLCGRVVQGSNAREYLLILHESKPLTSAEPFEGLGLTRRQAEIVLQLVNNLDATAIAGLLGISERTVQKHLQLIYAKLGVSSRTGAVIRALEWVRL